VKSLLALMVSVAFAAGMTGGALAQGQPTTPKEVQPAGKPAEGKKPTARNISGTVKTAAADSLVVTGKTKDKDEEWTFALGPQTKIRKAGKDITGADLAAGDLVHVRYHAEGGTNVAEAVMARAPKKAAAPPRAETPKKDEPKR
jgi:hypothetical protein